jgi:hypothetical protein
MFISFGLFFAKKAPKFLCLLLTIINIVMIFFVMNGATHDSNAYSNLYLVEYKFNQTSDISGLLAEQYTHQHNGTKLNDFFMRVGFMGVCVNFGGNDITDGGLDCGYTSDMNEKYDNEIPSFSVTSGKNNTSNAALQLFDIAYTIQNKTIKYQIFIVEIIFLLVVLVAQLYNMIGILPFQIYMEYFIILTITSFFTIVCISITWLMVTQQNLQSIGNVMTMNILTFTQGNRPQGILWAVFALAIIQLGFYVWNILKKEAVLSNMNMKRSKGTNDIEKDIGSINNSVMSSITTLRGTL